MQNIDAQTVFYGLIGHPVGHSRSPLLQNELIRQFGLNAAYMAMNVESGGLKDFVQGMHKAHAGGFNVTVPYKKDVIEELVSIDEAAQMLGAVNTLKYTDKGWAGYNTDLPGFRRALAYDGVSLKGKNVVLLGAGGAAMAVLAGIFQEGAARVLAANRTEEKAAELIGRFEHPGCMTETAVMDGKYLAKRMGELSAEPWTAVQCTSVGMLPHTEEAPVTEPEFYLRLETAYDIIFNPARTKFMRLAAEAGAKDFNGLRMLVFQGIRSFEIWHNVKVTDEQALEVLKLAEESFRA